MPFLTISYRNKRSFAGLTVGTCELVDLDSAVVVLTQLEVLDAVVLVGRVLDQVVAHSVRARISGNLLCFPHWEKEKFVSSSARGKLNALPFQIAIQFFRGICFVPRWLSR